MSSLTEGTPVKQETINPTPSPDNFLTTLVTSQIFKISFFVFLAVFLGLYLMTQESIFMLLFFIVFLGGVTANVIGYFYKTKHQDSGASLKKDTTTDTTTDTTKDTTEEKNKKNTTPTPPLPSSSTLQYIKRPPQVFNIPGNKYDYENAQAICSAYGSRLANYDEIEKAYEEGAEWCNYGWSSGQMALYPTQKKSYDVLQTVKGHEHDCGHPGINGGYFPDAKLKFGVNCFGYKPKITPEETDLMKNTSPYPLSGDQAHLEQLIKTWKTQINNILVAPYNYTQWSRI